MLFHLADGLGGFEFIGNKCFELQGEPLSDDDQYVF
jgi:hypothetical protein